MIFVLLSGIVNHYPNLSFFDRLSIRFLDWFFVIQELLRGDLF